MPSALLRAFLDARTSDEAMLVVDPLAAELTRRGALDVMVGESIVDARRVDVELVADDHLAALRLLEEARACCGPA